MKLPKERIERWIDDVEKARPLASTGILARDELSTGIPILRPPEQMEPDITEDYGYATDVTTNRLVSIDDFAGDEDEHCPFATLLPEMLEEIAVLAIYGGDEYKQGLSVKTAARLSRVNRWLQSLVKDVILKYNNITPNYLEEWATVANLGALRPPITYRSSEIYAVLIYTETSEKVRLLNNLQSILREQINFCMHLPVVRSKLKPSQQDGVWVEFWLNASEAVDEVFQTWKSLSGKRYGRDKCNQPVRCYMTQLELSMVEFGLRMIELRPSASTDGSQKPVFEPLTTEEKYEQDNDY